MAERETCAALAKKQQTTLGARGETAFANMENGRAWQRPRVSAVGPDATAQFLGRFDLAQMADNAAAALADERRQRAVQLK